MEPQALTPDKNRFVDRFAKAARSPVFLVWAFVTLVSLIKAWPDLKNGLLPGNDDYMRLVQIRDWLGGQSWGDALQHRLYPPDPLLSHWTRLPDILTGGLIKIFTPLLGAETAQLFALIFVPLGLFLLAISVAVKLACGLSSSKTIAWATAISIGLAYPVFYQFAPGRIDHHGLQIVLALLTALFIIRSEGAPWLAGLAGLICGASLWVGIESAPYVAAACIAIGLIWALDEGNAKARLASFAVMLALSTALCLGITRPLSEWGAACDGLSTVYVVMSAAIAIAMIICSGISGLISKPWVRLLIISGLGLAAAIVTLGLYPQCLGGPYAQLDPRLSDIWLANVREAKPLWVFIADYPVTAMAMLIVPAFAVLGYFSRNTEAGSPRIIQSVNPRTLIIFTIVSAAAGLIQTRMFSFSAALGAPLAGALIVTALSKTETIQDAGRKALAKGGLWLALSPLFLPVMAALVMPAPPARAVETPSGEPTCLSAQALTSLRALEDGFAITQIDMGAPILAHSDLSVSSAPYHRNEGGLVLALNVFLGDEASAKKAAQDSGADYLIVCLVGPETRLFKKMGQADILKQIADGAAPDWLTPIPLSPPSDLRAYHLPKAAPR